MFSRQIFLSGDKVPDRAPLVEYLIDNAVMRPILEKMMGRTWVDTSDQTEYMGGQMVFSEANLEIVNVWLDNQIAFRYPLGYDSVRVEVSPPLPATALVVGNTAAGNQDHNRAWQGLHDGSIKSWEDFEIYPWPMTPEKNVML